MSTTMEKETINTKPEGTIETPQQHIEVTAKPVEGSHHGEHKESHIGGSAVTGLEQVPLPQPPEHQHIEHHTQPEKHGQHLPAAATTESGVGVPHVGPTHTQQKPHEAHVVDESVLRKETSGEKVIKQVSEYKVGDKEANHHYIYSKHPSGGQFSDDVFRFEETHFPRDPSTDNEILIRLTYISIDAFTRNRMSEKKEFIQPFRLNDVLEGEATAEIIKSNNPKYEVGQNIVGFFKWTKYQIINVQNFPFNVIPHDIHPSYFLSIFGMPGLTAYFGITEYSKLKPQHNVLVSGACGSVGLFVGQILRIKGCNKLIGLESSEEKIHQSLLFGYNECFNTHSQDLNQILKTAFPEGIDIYWDNIGGSTLDTVIEHMRPHGRIIMCGTLSETGSEEKRYGLTKIDRIIAKSLTIQGLFCAEFTDRFPKAYKQLLHWYHDGKIKTKETTLEGFHHIPKAFSSLMSGETMGKTVVHVEPKPAQVA
jgi:NADPH-dependent curcumin reductase CurA